MDEETQKQIFTEWLNAHKGIFFKIMRAYAFTPHDQDDLFQEISLQVWKSIPDFKGDSKASTWIYRVALFTAATWVRQAKKRLPDHLLTDVEYALKVVDDQPSDPRVDWLYEQIGRLDPIDRSICLLMLEGFSYKEIADLAGISSSNVGVKIHRIKQTLLARKEQL